MLHSAKFHASFLALLCTACGSKAKIHEGAAATARLNVINHTPSSSAALTTPNYLGLKVVSIKLMADKDNCDTTVCPTIWVSPSCESHDSSQTIDGASFHYAVPDPCADDKVGYLDFAQNTGDLAGKLNAQTVSVVPGTYNYVEFTFAEGPLQRNAIAFKAAGMSDTFSAKIKGLWAIESVKADEPLVINEGDAVTVDVNYDLTGTIATEADGSYCYSAESVTRCQRYPKFNVGLHKASQDKNTAQIKDHNRGL